MNEQIKKAKITQVNGFQPLEHPTRSTIELSKKESKELIKDHVKRIAHVQEKMFAQQRHALLLVFQAMDAAGKDSAIRHVLSGINPQGCEVHSFKHPSTLELEHDYL
ncbi:MAG: hypothetical protein KDC12_14125, partial [Flavobacteriales bacterium]|nr:hypothetical protein [Flavobacteriales bacterium]